jgi:hypothetical protein
MLKRLNIDGIMCWKDLLETKGFVEYGPNRRIRWNSVILQLEELNREKKNNL